MSDIGKKDPRIVVARIIDRLNVGGPAMHFALTGQHLDPAKYRTVLIHGSVEENEADMTHLTDAVAAAGIERVVIPELGRELRPFKDARTLWKLTNELRRIRPDVVHTHKAKAGALGRTAATMIGCRARVHTFHGHVFSGYFSPRKTQAFVAIERGLARVADRLIALSPALIDELAGTYRIAPRDKFTVVPLGLDLDRFAQSDRHRGELRAHIGTQRHTRLVGIVGRLVPVKDHATFLAAAEILAQRHTDLEFVIVGGGELIAEVTTRASVPSLRSRVHLLGWRDDLERIYPDLDVVALSSVNEGTPVTLIEAMASGIPVASTRVGGVADLLGHGARGELADPRNPESLADAIERALQPNARERAKTLRAAIVEEYGYQRLCRDLDRLYQELLTRR